MGYTHYWYTKQGALDPTTFGQFALDAAKIIVTGMKGGLKLAGPLGEGVPVISADEIAFNGANDCGHGANERCVRVHARDSIRGRSGVMDENHLETLK